VADASHELRTRVTLLSTPAQLMRRALHAGADPHLARGELDGLVKDTAALTEVLDDLLLAADPGAETGGAVVDLVEMARQVAASTTPAAQARGISRRALTAPPWRFRLARRSATGDNRAVTTRSGTPTPKFDCR
jgi:two-component system, OmpR family, sensor kinase